MLCRKSVTLKCASNDCYREASLYCKKSAKYFCEKCTGKHDALPTELNFHPVKRSHWSNSMLPYCKDHDAFEKLFCLSCAKLCCKYCKYEFHSEPPLVLKQLLDLANRYHLFRSWCSFQEASSLLFFLRSDFTADITLAIFETFIDSF